MSDQQPPPPGDDPQQPPQQPQQPPYTPDPQQPQYSQPQYSDPQYAQTPYTQPAGYPSYPSGGDSSMQTGSSGKGFFGALFDFSFSTFVTPMIVKFVYVLATVALVLTYIGFVITGFNDSASAGLFFLIIGAVVAVVYLAFIRMTLEFYYAIVRMSQDINRRLPGA